MIQRGKNAGPRRKYAQRERDLPELRRRRKFCFFCENNINYVDYKDERLLRRFVNERGKLIPRRITGNCATHQRKTTKAIKRARILAIMAFESESYR